MKQPRWLHPLWRSAPLILQAQQEYDVGLEDALSMLLGAVKRFRMAISVDGWPLNGMICATPSTTLVDLVDFAYLLGLRVLPMHMTPTAPAAVREKMAEIAASRSVLFETGPAVGNG